METAPAHHDAVMADLKGHDDDCLDNIHLALGLLRSAPPDPDERLGLLADRFEVFALRVPGCGRSRLVVSVDTREERRPRMVHGTLGGLRLLERARDLAATQRGLTGPLWET